MGFKDQIVKKNVQVSTKEKINLHISEKVIPEDLYKIELEIKELKKRATNNIWLIGQRLSKINKEKLFKNKKYDTFDNYCETELNFSRQRAYDFIRLCDKYSYENYEDHGSKLFLFTSFSEEERNALMNETNNMSFREAKELVKEKKKEEKSLMSECSDKFKSIQNHIIIIGKSKVTIDFKKMGIKLKKDKSDELQDKLEKLIKEYADIDHKR